MTNILDKQTSRVGAVFALAIVAAFIISALPTISDSSEADAADTDYNSYYYDRIDKFCTNDPLIDKDFTKKVHKALMDIDEPFTEPLVLNITYSSLSNDEVRKSYALAKYIFENDHPERFWVDTHSMSISGGSGTLVITIPVADYGDASISITDATSLASAMKQIDDIIDSWGIKSTDTTVKKIEKINENLVKLLAYDKSSIGTHTMASRNMATAFLSTEHKVVCEGYTTAFKYCCDKYDIPCIIVTGNYEGSTSGHAWVNVNVDGVWYLADPTWNDRSDGKYLMYLLHGSDDDKHGVDLKYWATDPVCNPDGLLPTLNEKGYYMYTVKFVDWDGTVLKSETAYIYDKVSTPATPTRDGYKFVEWKDCKTNPVEVTGNATYTAVYEKSGGSGGGSGGMCNLTIAAIIVSLFSVAAIPAIRYVRP